MKRIAIKNWVGGELDVLISSYTDALVPNKGTISLEIVDGKIMAVEDVSSSKVVVESKKPRKAFKVGMGWVSNTVATLAQGETMEFDLKSPNDVGPTLTEYLGEYLLLRPKNQMLICQVFNNDSVSFAFWLKTSPQDFPVKGTTIKIAGGSIPPSDPNPTLKPLNASEQLILHYPW